MKIRPFAADSYRTVELGDGTEMKCEPKIAMICKQHGISYKIRQLKFGYERVEIECDSYAELVELRDELRKVKGAAVDTVAHFMGEFSGRLCIMDAADEEELLELVNEETGRVEDWWNRYHVADAETRRLMACGAIA